MFTKKKIGEKKEFVWNYFKIYWMGHTSDVVGEWTRWNVVIGIIKMSVQGQIIHGIR